MFRNALWITLFGLIVGGCASDATMESSGGTSGDSGSTMSGRAAGESSSMNQSNSSKNRVAAGVEEETLNTCLAHIPQDATVGQKMMAEQTCRRDYAGRR